MQFLRLGGCHQGPSKSPIEIAFLMPRSLSWYEHRWVLVMIVALGATIRLVELGDVPPGLFIDEVWSSYFPYIFYESGDPTKWAPVMAISQLMTGQLFTYALAGDSAFWTRFPTAMFGVAAIPLTYALVNHWFGRRLAVLSALGLAVAPWALHFSRYSVPSMATAVWLMMVLFSIEKLVARRTAGWLGLLTFSIIAAFSSHAITKIFLPLFLIGYLVMRRHEVRLVLRTLLGPTVVALLIVIGYLLIQVMALFGGGEGFAIQASLVSNMAFVQEGLTTGEAIGVAERYVQHWDPRYLFITGDPSPLYGTGVGGALGIPGVFVLVGLWSVWRQWRHPVAKTILLWALLWPLPSALVVPDNPNTARGTFGLSLLVILGAMGLSSFFRWAFELRSRRPTAAKSSAVAAAVILISGILTSSYYFLAWPTRPGIAAKFNYGYEQAAETLSQLPQRHIIISDVYRAQDLLAFNGLGWSDIESVAPGLRLQRDAFVGRMPAYFLTSKRQELARLRSFGYRTKVLETIETPTGEDRLWLASIAAARRWQAIDLSSVNLVAPLAPYPPVSWDGATGQAILRSEETGEGQRAVAYAVLDEPMSASMRVNATVPVQREAQGDLMVGFSSYRNPTLGAPDKIAPFIATFVKLRFMGNGSYQASAHSESVDDRKLSFDLGSGRGITEVQVAYRYLDGYRNTYRISHGEQWSAPIEVTNYLKRSLYLFIGLISDEPARVKLTLDTLEISRSRKLRATNPR